MRRLLQFTLMLAAGAAFAGQPPPAGTPQITADRMEIDFAAGALVYRGQARVQLDGATLTADELRYRHDGRVIEARGHVVLTHETRRLLAAEMNYHLDSRRYLMRDLRFGQAPLYVSGSLLEGDLDVLRFTDARVSFGEPGRWAPTFKADAVHLFPNRERFRAEGAALGLGLWQPLPLPGVELPTNLDFLSYLSMNAGFSGSLGAFAELGVHLPVGTGTHLGGDIGYFTQRGLLAGPSGTYHVGAGTSGDMLGSFQSGFIHDTGERQVDVRGDPVPEDRGFVSWTHRQALARRLSLTAVVNYWSDSEILRDFRPADYFDVQTPDTFAELAWVGDHTVLGFFTRIQPNPYHAMRERLPELTFTRLPSPLGAGWYHEIQASAAALRDTPPEGGVELRSDRLDAYYSLTRPSTPRPWLTVAPVAGARMTHYANLSGAPSADEARDAYTRTLGELGLDAELRASGTFDYRNERWGIDGLRHLVTPRLSYRYIPDAAKGSAHIPPIDRRVFATYLEPLGLGARRQIDDLASTHTLRLGVDNRLQTRADTYGSRDLVAFQVAADTRFDPGPGQRTLSALHSELRLTPAPWLVFEFYQRLQPGDWSNEEFNTTLTLHNADQWVLSVGNHYLQGEIQEYLAGFAYRLNEVYELYTRLHYDFRLSRFNEQRYGVNQTLENRWVVGYEVSFFEGPRRESGFGFNLRLQTIAF